MIENEHPTGNYVQDQRLPLDFSLGENPWGCSPLAIESLCDVNPNIISLYPDNFGRHMCKALAKHHCLDSEWFCIGSGALGVLDLIFRSVMGRQVKCLIPAVTFPSYSIIARMYKMETVLCKMGPEVSIDVSELCRKIDHIRPQLTVIANPNNPTGKLLSMSELETLVSSTMQHGLLVLDEANIDFCENSFHGWVEYHDDWPPHVIIVRSFSKAYGLASQRIGYAIGQPDTIKKLLMAWVDFPVAETALRAACAALSDVEYVQQCNLKMQESRGMLTAGLKRLGLKVLHSDSNYLLVDLEGQCFTSDMFAKNLAVFDIAVLSGTRFTGLGNRYLRISPRTIKENEILISRIQQVMLETKNLI